MTLEQAKKIRFAIWNDMLDGLGEDEAIPDYTESLVWYSDGVSIQSISIAHSDIDPNVALLVRLWHGDFSCSVTSILRTDKLTVYDVIKLVAEDYEVDRMIEHMIC